MNIPDSRSLATIRPGLQPEPKRLDLFQSLRKHLRLSLFLLVVLVATGGYLAHEHNVVTYSSYAEVHVARNAVQAPDNGFVEVADAAKVHPGTPSVTETRY